MKFLTFLFIHYSLFTIHHSVAADAAAESSQGKRSTAEQRTTAGSASSIKPNVIVIMADDLGYGDVGCYGAKPENIKTPHIDQLAAEGLRFTNFHVGASVSAPCLILPPVRLSACAACLPAGLWLTPLGTHNGDRSARRAARR